ncbi:hypothetical protein EIN_503840 [Entamoeba invadens IP1]|uniref:Uncharacterized protein n=1 Tax=Entamoeba invadens IP1 TaxID=370355 RepID=A0A0A1UD80_ENTIV|nr:hypothetical protein EIN_503840 [Entamoeba invadens IP1]ELP90278.1 hypothetical protein EIN_503840 [Entamoeba invadens IP1]|eukprot:XP_004257049.1 hypothetical protein EIN_503840 [Entamoeba invadens IP1]
MSTPEEIPIPMLLVYPRPFLDTGNANFVAGLVNKIKTCNSFEKSSVVCYVVGLAKHPRSNEKAIVIATTAMKGDFHIFRLLVTCSQNDVLIYTEYKIPKLVQNGEDFNDFTLCNAVLNQDLNGIVVLETKRSFLLYSVINTNGVGKMEELVLSPYQTNRITQQVEIVPFDITKGSSFAVHTQDSMWTVSFKTSLFSKKVLIYKHETYDEACCFVLNTMKDMILITTKDVYSLIPFEPLQRIENKFNTMSFKTFTEMYFRYRRLCDKSQPVSFTSTQFMKKQNDFSAFVTTTSFPLIEPNLLNTLPESKTKKPVIQTIFLGKYYYIFILKAMVWICDENGVLHTLESKGSPYETLFVDSDLIFFVSDNRVSVYDFHPTHQTVLVESMKSLKAKNLLNLRRLDDNLYIEDLTFNIFQLDYNPHYFVEYLYSPTNTRLTFLHMLFHTPCHFL